MAHLITLNAGSSSIKFALFDAGDDMTERLRGSIDGLGAAPRLTTSSAGQVLTDEALDADRITSHATALGAVLDYFAAHLEGGAIEAVGHRIVHGGTDFAEPTIVDTGTLSLLERLNPLAPLHQPHNVSGIRAAQAAFPDALQVACFDTAFHRTHPFVSDTYALPRQFYDAGVRRYGFHGLSYEYVAHRLKTVAPAQAAGRVVVTHLGNGASMCAIADGRSQSSTMGFTPLDGLPMGTRCGQIDPGVLIYLVAENHMSAAELQDLLYRQSGLKGLSGLSHDMRALEAAGTEAAEQAIAYFVARIRRELGAMAADLGGLDAVVFCGGIGENSPRMRARVCQGFEWLGLTLDPARNSAGATLISAERSRVPIFVINTNEEAMIAQHTARFL